MARAYRILDVFTDRALAGNPLAVVLDAGGLTDATMQAVAAEFNLSETVFVLPPADPEHRARLRIFTPSRELPFAGHPTVGSAVCLAALDRLGEAGEAVVTLEEQVGAVRCRVSVTSVRTGIASCRLPALSQRVASAPAPEVVAGGLGLSPADIGFDGHGVGVWSAGVPFLLVPVGGRDAVRRARVVPEAWARLRGATQASGVFVYSSDCEDPAHQFHARMFAPDLGVAEDPATGAAVAALAGQIVEAETPRDGSRAYVVEQGFEMGRPSLIRLELTVEAGSLRRAALAGAAVVVAEGQLHI
ncbi:MAG: PhzF family phenazine biosynthesis protein [Rhodospirillales bacterium]|nr:PhzF family phenazine biosynthesis protein [Rhodospirillales bacterium]